MFYVHICGSQCKHLRTYVVHKKENHVHLEKRSFLVHTSGRTFPGLSTVLFLSVGHYPCYESPDFNIIKSLSALVFPSVFFQGFIPETFGVIMCLIWFPSLCFCCMFI
jgi:hypothetical protein